MVPITIIATIALREQSQSSQISSHGFEHASYNLFENPVACFVRTTSGARSATYLIILKRRFWVQSYQQTQAFPKPSYKM